MSITPGNETTAAAERLVPGATIEPVGARSWLVSATTAGGRFSVRQFDPGLPTIRIELIHEFLAQPELRHATPLAGMEHIGTAEFDSRRWAEGNVLGHTIPGSDWRSLHLPGSIDPEMLEMVAAALGEFHHSGTTASLTARAPRFKAKDAIASVRRSIELNERALASEIRKESRARHWLAASRPLLAHAETNLEQAGFLRDEPLVMAHLDIWGCHIVAGAESETTFLDFAMIGAAPAVVDLSQLLARNGEWSDDRVERVLNGYTKACSFPPAQRRVIPWLTALDAIAGCGFLLAREHDERRPLPVAERRNLQAAADQQLQLLQRLAVTFVPAPQRHYRRPGQRSSRRDR